MPRSPQPESAVARPSSRDSIARRRHTEYLGQTLDGRYRLRCLLGRGGMGSVFLAEHVTVGRPLAVKVVEGRDASADEITRIFREAQSAAAIGHPNIVDIIDVGVSSFGDPYLVMEYLEGEDLQSFMQHEGPLPMAAACAVVEPVLLALSAAHRKGVVHRDLKPANIFLAQREDGSATVKLIDFGIAKLIGAAVDGKITMTGALLGTPSYMSPEQAVGVTEVDQRVDLYGVGVVLYQLVAGRLPFEGANYNEILFRILNDEPRPPESIPGIAREAGAVIRKALGKNPASRYQSAQELLDALKRLDAWADRDRAFATVASRIRSEAQRQVAAGPGCHGADPSGSSGPVSDAPVGTDELPSTPVAPHGTRLPSDAPIRRQSMSEQPESPIPGGVPREAGGRPGHERSTRSSEFEPTRRSPRDPALEAACLQSPMAPSGSADTRSAPPPADLGDSASAKALCQPGAVTDTAPGPGLSAAPGAVHPTTHGGVTTPVRTKVEVGRLAAITAVTAAALVGVGIWDRVAPRQADQAEPGRHEADDLADGVLVTITGVPPGATVTFDGAPISTNPFRTRRSRITVPIRIEVAGFEPYVTTIVPSKDSTVGATMQRRTKLEEPQQTTSLALASASPSSDPSPSPRAGSTRGAPGTSGVPTASPRKAAPPASSAAPLPTKNPGAIMQKSGRDTLYTEDFE